MKKTPNGTIKITAMKEESSLFDEFIKEQQLKNLTRNQVAFIRGFLKLNTFGVTDFEMVENVFKFKKRNGN